MNVLFKEHPQARSNQMCIRDSGMGKRNNTILQSAFFTLAKVMPQEDAIRYMRCV